VKAGEHRSRLVLHVLLHLHEQVLRLLDVVRHHRLDHGRLHVDELRPHLGADLVRLIERLALLRHLALDIDEGLDVLLEVRTHHPLHRVAVEADDLRQHLGAEHRHSAGFLFEDDLQQDLARQILARLRVDHLKFLLFEHELLDVGQRDVGAGLRVVQPAVRILLDQANGWCHLCSSSCRRRDFSRGFALRACPSCGPQHSNEYDAPQRREVPGG
jgi:hypothetical protein